MLSLCRLLCWHIPTQCRGSGDAMATSIYGSAKFHYSVFMGYFVGRQSLSSTSMQFAIASQFVMADPPFTRPPTYPHTYILTSGAKSPVPMGLSSADGDHCCEPVLSEVLCCSVCVCVCVCVCVVYDGWRCGACVAFSPYCTC